MIDFASISEMHDVDGWMQRLSNIISLLKNDFMNEDAQKLKPN